jgi:hypothetical protein
MNIAEAQILALNVQAMAIHAEIVACQANDRMQEIKGTSGFYPEKTYINLSNELHRIAADMQILARN